MDQVLKDLMLEVAEQDQQAGMDGMQGDQGEEEVADIMGKVYKIRPFGIAAVNMRDLNPSGASSRLKSFMTSLNVVTQIPISSSASRVSSSAPHRSFRT